MGKSPLGPPIAILAGASPQPPPQVGNWAFFLHLPDWTNWPVEKAPDVRFLCEDCPSFPLCPPMSSTCGRCSYPPLLKSSVVGGNQYKNHRRSWKLCVSIQITHFGIKWRIWPFTKSQQNDKVHRWSQGFYKPRWNGQTSVESIPL